MKKLISIILTVLLIAATALTMTGCGKDSITVSSVMKIDDSFKGTRTVTIKYPLSADIDAIKGAIAAEDPTGELDGVSFNLKYEADCYRYELVFRFADRDEYLKQVSAVIGREANSNMSRKNTALTHAIRMQENFSSEDLIAWMRRANETDSSTKGMEINYDANTVTIGSDTFETGMTVNINEVSGSTVTVRSISIDTVNNKEGRYDRTVAFEFPNDDYQASKEVIDRFFADAVTGAKSSGWDRANTVYRVQYENLEINKLAKHTAQLLDTDSVIIRYEDIDDSSTPLSEGLTFAESFDTFSFVGPDKGAPTLHYSYSLPSNTTFSSGTVLKDGKWTSAGSWTDGKYTLDLDTGSVSLRVSDGIRYRIDGIDFRLDSLGSERFRRTTEFLYVKQDGRDGVNYAVDFFTKKGASATFREDDEHFICSVACEGTTTELTSRLVKLFGSGNFISYTKRSGAFSLATKSTFTDYIDLSSILNASNAERPMRYFISASGAESIDSVILDGDEKTYRSAEESYLELNGGVGTVEYYGSLPITSHIIVYILFGLLLLGVTIFGAYLMMNYRRPGLSPGAQRIVEAVGLSDDDGDEDALAALSQTTTFSISELGILSRNKAYVDEINQDIETRIELDRLTRRKKEIREKELEELGRKVYGSDTGSEADCESKPKAAPKAAPVPKDEPAALSPLDEVPELDINVLKAAVAKTSDPPEDHEADDEPDEPARKPASAPASAPEDPFHLLDQVAIDGDDDDF